MHVLHDTGNCPEALKGAALAIGNFDGVHRGHQAVLRAALDSARVSGVPCGVMTFEPHPRRYFRPDEPLFRLTPEPLKLELIEALGLDMAVELAFDAALAELPAARFVRELLVDGLCVSHVVTGNDFHFGKGRDGNPQVLRALGEEHGFSVTMVEARQDPGGVFSSTRIRDSLRNGDPRAAADALGYWWRVRGEVIGGDRRGHGLGFPTANVAVPDGFALAHGIYAVRVRAGGARYHGAAYLGTRPSFGGGEAVIETFLFDFTGDLYGQEIELELIEHLRGDRAFETTEALSAQMRQDCGHARAVLDALARRDPMLAYPLGRAAG